MSLDENALSVAPILENMNNGYHRMREMLRGMLGSDAQIDEMAVMAPRLSRVMGFLSGVVSTDGYVLFNTSFDHVTAGPIRSTYDVRYWFLSTPWPYRVELMALSGYSPLHCALQENQVGNELVLPVHASFKCKNEEHYGLATGVLRKAGWEQAQRCESTYGKFSYWQHDDATWLLKPRLNLRDAGGR